MQDSRTRRWQKIILGTLLVGYAGYYVCRSNLSVTTPLLVREGFTREEIGRVASIGVLLYALGKISNGVLVDFLGGRLLFLLGMVLSVACTILFGFGNSVLLFTFLWAVNRYVQSMGWGSLIKVASRWYPVSIHATIMGVLAMSYLFGDAVARYYLGFFMEIEVGWRGIFFIAAGTLGAIAFVSCFTLRGSPRDVGEHEPAANPANVFGAGGNVPQPESLRRLLGPLVRSGAFWLICLMSVGLTLIRETFNFWIPTYLTDVEGLKAGAAAQWSSLFPLAGAASVLLAGVASDRLAGKRGRIMLPSLVLLTAALWLLSSSSSQGKPVLVLSLISAVALFLYPPYSFLAGVLALDLGGKRGSSTAAGLIDSAGYLGATLSGGPIGSLAENYGWPAVFAALAVTAGLTALTAGVYWVLQDRPFTKRGATMPADDLQANTGNSGSQKVDKILQIFQERGDAAYLGEPVSQTEHALQAAWAAEKAGADSALITAALLHDLGHLLHDLGEHCAQEGVDDVHEARAARALRDWFGPEVTEPIRLHVAAKRFLCASEPGYFERLSEASVVSLRLQGGPFSPAEARAFQQNPHAEAAIALRRWDEEAKIQDLKTPDLEHFRPYLEAALVTRDS